LRYFIDTDKSEEVPNLVQSLICLGASDIHIVNNCDLANGSWEISFIHYSLTCKCVEDMKNFFTNK